MSDDRVCTGACAPGFHPRTTPANEYGRAPASAESRDDAVRTLGNGLADRFFVEAPSGPLGCHCGACQAMMNGHA